jgi:hypothetical protein
MFHRTFLNHHGLALGMVAAGIIVLATGAAACLVFAAWMILTGTLYICGWIYYLMVMRDRITVGHRLRSVAHEKPAEAGLARLQKRSPQSYVLMIDV